MILGIVTMTSKVLDYNPDENILISKDLAKIKLIDFGSMSPFNVGEKEKVFTGTLRYGPPEVQRMHLEATNTVMHTVNKDGFELEKQEVWTLGVLLHNLAFGMDPFQDQRQILERDIRKHMTQYVCKTKVARLKMVSSEVMDLITLMLKKDPKDRPTLDQVMKHAFFDTRGMDIYEWARTKPKKRGFRGFLSACARKIKKLFK